MSDALHERFEIEGELGRGAMGVVWRARERATDRRVAIKIAPRPAEGVQRERFRREGELTARLNHPGVVRVHASGESEGKPWIAYELVEVGASFEEALRGAPPQELARLLSDAARALGAAHELGIVHRDVKPANVLLDGEGRVRVADFGLATAGDLERLTLTGALLGTPTYMSPEQLAGGGAAVGPPTDVWALGVILYEALTGRPPYEGGSLFEFVSAVERGALTPPRAIEPTVPVALDAICRRAIRHEPQERYPTGAALADDLDRFREGRSVEAQAEAGRSRLAGVVVVLLAIGVTAAWAALRPRASEPPAPVPTEVAAVETATVVAAPTDDRWPARAETAAGRATDALRRRRYAEALEQLQVVCEYGHRGENRARRILHGLKKLVLPQEVLRWSRRHPRGRTAGWRRLCLAVAFACGKGDWSTPLRWIRARRAWLKRGLEVNDPWCALALLRGDRTRDAPYRPKLGALIEDLAAQGDPTALAAFAQLHWLAIGRPRDDAAGLRRLRAGGSTCPRGRRLMALAYRDGRGVEPDGEQAAVWFRRAYAAGVDQAGSELIGLLGSGRAKAAPGELDRLIQALDYVGWVERLKRRPLPQGKDFRAVLESAERGDRLATSAALGILIEESVDVPRGIRLLLRHATAGDASMSQRLGAVLVGRFGDVPDGLFWIRRAAAAGYPAALSRLAVFLSQPDRLSIGLEQDMKQAVALWEAAYAKGDMEAAISLAYAYRTGQGGLPENRARARRILERLVAAKNLGGRIQLAWLLLKEAREGRLSELGRLKTITRKLMAEDVAEGFLIMSSMRRLGVGGARDESAALFLLHRSAQTQHPLADFALGVHMVKTAKRPAEREEGLARIRRAGRNEYQKARDFLNARHRRKLSE